MHKGLIVQRPLKTRIFLFLSGMKIKIIGFSVAQWLIFVSSIILTLSLFVPWFSLGSTGIFYGAFSRLLGIHGILIVFCVCLNFYALFFQLQKQKIQFNFHYSVNDSFICFFSLFISLITLFGTYNSIYGLSTFSSEQSLHIGLDIITFGVFTGCIGCVLLYRLQKPGYTISVNES